MKRALIRTMWLAVAGTAWCLAQDAQPGAAATQDPPAEVLPIRLEFGARGSQVSDGLGTWRGGQALLWIRNNDRFIPALFFDTQTRPTGTQQNYGFFSYLNWSRSFYTVQGFSTAPQRNDQAIFFPKRRYDIKAYWKLPPSRNVVLAAGFTRFDFGGPGHGQIFNAGALYYHRKLVLEGNAFVNRTQPGDAISGAGSLAAQYGREGDYWFGVTAGGGREQYRLSNVTPTEIRLSSYSLNVFYRKWLSRHFGFVVFFDYQDKLDAYRLAGGAVNLFFEF